MGSGIFCRYFLLLIARINNLRWMEDICRHVRWWYENHEMSIQSTTIISKKVTRTNLKTQVSDRYIEVFLASNTSFQWWIVGIWTHKHILSSGEKVFISPNFLLTRQKFPAFTLGQRERAHIYWRLMFPGKRRKFLRFYVKRKRVR